MDRYLLDIERLKKIEPIMNELGVEANEYLCLMVNDELMVLNEQGLKVYSQSEKLCNTYDHAALESVLPDWEAFGESVPSFDLEHGYTTRFCLKMPIKTEGDLLMKVLFGKGQKKLESMADTIILLHENNLLKKQKEKNSNGK